MHIEVKRNGLRRDLLKFHKLLILCDEMKVAVKFQKSYTIQEFRNFTAHVLRIEEVERSLLHGVPGSLSRGVDAWKRR
jgi:hypothetical protein